MFHTVPDEQRRRPLSRPSRFDERLPASRVRRLEPSIGKRSGRRRGSPLVPEPARVAPPASLRRVEEGAQPVPAGHRALLPRGGVRSPRLVTDAAGRTAAGAWRGRFSRRRRPSRAVAAGSDHGAEGTDARRERAVRLLQHAEGVQVGRRVQVQAREGTRAAARSVSQSKVLTIFAQTATSLVKF